MHDHLLLTGGGTLGPVTPLLAVASEWKKEKPDGRISFIGTPKGPERALVEGLRYDFYALHAPKFDRTRLWKLPFILPFFLLSLVQSFSLLKKIQPDAVLSAGAYVSVPVAIAAFFLRIPVWTHQLDVTPGLANKLMAPFAKKITVTWSESAAAFSKKKTFVVGAMARKSMTVGDKGIALDRYGFNPQKPTVFVTGGGTGAASINDMMAIIGPELKEEANVLHLTGQGKSSPKLQEIGGNYVPLEFLSVGMADAYAVADVVICRAGMGTIAELVALKKPTILIPMPNSHQGANALALEERGAALVIHHLTPQTLLQAIEKLLHDKSKQAELSENIRTLFPLNADEWIVKDILKTLEGK
jgi:UDP-N-acetylglucosamine--N-acetylmuramyl-(pentapeptide) pyrophosphoryl-undecaprenol N-acetylglucosamine transferase